MPVYYEPDPTGFNDDPVIQPGAWEDEIQELEAAEWPSRGTAKISGCVVVDNIQAFVHGHLETVKANNGNPTYRPYLDRLKELRKILDQ